MTTRALKVAACACALAWLHACASAKSEEKPSAQDPSAAEPPASAAPMDSGWSPFAPSPPAYKAPVEKPAEVPHVPDDLRDVRVVAGEKEGESVYQHYGTNPTVDTAEEPTSTFSIDVDTASYSIARSFLNDGALPPPEAVRVEEIVNALKYDWAPPDAKGGAPFSVVAEAFPSPNRQGYHLLMLGLRGKVVQAKDRAPANLVFVIDVSGSMEMDGRLELVKRSLGMLVDQLREDDSVAIVIYGDTARTLLHPTSGGEKRRIQDALARLRPEGSTNVQAGVMLGYEAAHERQKPGTLSRIIVCSDGVANNGITDADAIFDTVANEAKRGVTLTTIGVGMHNYNDVLMERLAVRGQGRYAYVDSLKQAKHEFVDQLTGNLVTIARDVKVQVAFDPQGVSRYRLIGFENRKLANRDFANDTVDAGEIGAGHEMTALYEVKLRPGADRLGTLRVRSKVGEGASSDLVETPLEARLVRTSLAATSPESRTALVASAYGEKLRGSYWVRNLSWDQIVKLYDALPADTRAHEDVAELGALIKKARTLDARGDRFEGEQPVATMDFDQLPVVRRR